MTAIADDNSCNNQQDVMQQPQPQRQQESSTLRVLGENGFRSLLDDDADDDDEDFIVVSSTQQRLDLLLAEEDDDIIVLRSIPSANILNENDNTKSYNKNHYFTLVFAILGGVFLLWALSLRKCFRSKRKAHCNEMAEETSPKRKAKDKKDQDINPRTPKKCKQGPQSQRLGLNTDNQTQKDESSTQIPPSPPPDDDNTTSEPPALVEYSSLRTMENMKIQQHLSLSPPQKKSSNPNENIILELSSLESMTTKTMTTITTTEVDIAKGVVDATASSQAHKLQVAREIAQDIKLVEDVLKNEGIVNNHQSLAAQLAVGWHSSERIIHSQRETEFRRMLLDTHQRNLDRQLSERQHEETLQAATYDPNWNEKLQAKRDKCWNVASRLVWEGGLAYQCARLVRPILRLYMASDDFSVNNMAQSVLSNLCDCKSADSSLDAPGSTYFYSLFSFSQTTTMFQYFGLDSLLDVGMCYAYCISSSLLLFGCVAIFHRALHIFCSPAIFHHLANGAALIVLAKPSMSNMGLQSLQKDPQFATLGAAIIGIFGVVHWNYRTCQNEVKSTLRSNFQKSLQNGLDRLDSLYGMLNVFRYVVVALCCYTSVAFDFESSSREDVVDTFPDISY